MRFDISVCMDKRYVDVSVTIGGTKIDLGLLDEEEREELAQKLHDCADELLQGIYP